MTAEEFGNLQDQDGYFRNMDKYDFAEAYHKQEVDKQQFNTCWCGIIYPTKL